MSMRRFLAPFKPTGSRQRSLRRVVMSTSRDPEVLERRSLLSASGMTPANPDHTGTWHHRGDDPVSAEVAAPSGVRAITDIAYESVGGREQHLDLYVPTGTPPAGGWPVILGLPGGGWRWVARGSMDAEVAPFASDGYVVAVADYQFASNSGTGRVWPTNFGDVENAVRWLRGNAGKFGIDSTKIAVLGQSAGANLGDLLGTDPAGAAGITPEKGPDATLPDDVEAVVDFYGPTDLTQLYADATKDRPFLTGFLGGTPDQVAQNYADASPVNHVTSSSPPFLIYQGLTDTATVPSQATELASALEAAGVPHIAVYVPSTPHGFWVKPFKDLGPDLTPQILEFLDEALNHHGEGIPDGPGSTSTLAAG